MCPSSELCSEVKGKEKRQDSCSGPYRDSSLQGPLPWGPWLCGSRNVTQPVTLLV